VDLSLDARVQWGQEQADLDANLDVVARDRHLPGGTGPREAQRVTVPRVGPAVLAAQALGHVLGQTSGLLQAQTVRTLDDDLTHRVDRFHIP
jgi:hypothetical protein